MSPEELKVVAEGMGYEVRLTELFEPVTASGELCLKGTQVRYNPLTNDTQCMEIMEKLNIDIGHGTDKVFAKCWGEIPVKIQIAKNEHSGKTINEAACKAALEYFMAGAKKGEQDG